MDITILDEKSEGNATCYLCRIKLSQYLSTLDADFCNWDIQRGIVNNSYLDGMIDTVLENRHIPPLVLVTSEKVLDEKSITKFKILDGLQRTFRLKTIDGSFKLIKFQIENTEDNIFKLSKFKQSKIFKDKIDDYNADIKIIRAILSKLDNIEDFYKSYNTLFESYQWFEVWYNLDVSEQINKMLMLNAGHVAVSTHHQVELLFRNLLDEINLSNKGINIILSKNTSIPSYSKKRGQGDFLFSHLVSSFISLTEGKATPTNSALIKKVQDNHIKDEFSYNLINNTCNFIINLDRSMVDEYNDVALKWLSREVVLNGIFSDIGEYKKEKEITYDDALNRASEVLCSRPKSLNLNKFDEEKTKKDISKINIGKYSRNAVCSAVKDLLNGEATDIKWSKYFGGEDE